MLPSEIENFKKLKKSLVSKIDIKKGTKITLSMIGAKRPGTGIKANELKLIIGKKAKKDIPMNKTLKQNMIK